MSWEMFDQAHLNKIFHLQWWWETELSCTSLSVWHSFHHGNLPYYPSLQAGLGMCRKLHSMFFHSEGCNMMPIVGSEPRPNWNASSTLTTLPGNTQLLGHGQNVLSLIWTNIRASYFQFRWHHWKECEFTASTCSSSIMHPSDGGGGVGGWTVHSQKM